VLHRAHLTGLVHQDPEHHRALHAAGACVQGSESSPPR
jgi:hypothetical protein